jgi:membrane-bound ClpP family serine protease
LNGAAIGIMHHKMTEKAEKSARKAWVIVLVSLIDDVIILVLVGLVLWYFKVRIPLWAMIVIGLALAAFIFVRTWYVLPSLRQKKITGKEGMIGLVGEVVESVEPGMVVRVSGEYWQAECPDGDVAAGEEVEIVRVNRLKLEVKRRTS